MAGWRRLRLTLGVVEDNGEANEEKGETEREERAEMGREVEKQVEKYREKGKKKGVTWADEADGGCLEKTRVVSPQGPPSLLVVPGYERRVCGETLGCEVGGKEERVKVECVGLDRDEDVVMGDVKDVDEASEDVMPSNTSEDPSNGLPPSSSTPSPSASPPPYSTASPPSFSPTPSPVEVEIEASHHQQHPTIRDGDDLDLRTDTDVRIPGWDSDLSNLSESDSSASETDSATDSDSADESDSDTTGPSASTVPVRVILTVRLPSPLSSFFSPTSFFCSNHSNQPKRASKSAFVYPPRDPPRLSVFVHLGIVVRFWRLEMGMSINGRFVCCVGQGSERGGG